MREESNGHLVHTTIHMHNTEKTNLESKAGVKSFDNDS